MNDSSHHYAKRDRAKRVNNSLSSNPIPSRIAIPQSDSSLTQFSESSLLQLQSLIGNRAVQRLVAKSSTATSLQRKRQAVEKSAPSLSISKSITPQPKIQRTPGKAGQQTLFHPEENESQSIQLDSQTTFEIDDNYEFKYNAYIKVIYTIDGEQRRGWIPYADVQPMEVETQLNAYVEDWRKRIDLKNAYMSYSDLKNFVDVEAEIDRFQQLMSGSWSGFYLSAYESRLTGFRNFMKKKVTDHKVATTINYIFHALSSNQDTAQAQWIFSNWPNSLNVAGFKLQPEVILKWQALKKVAQGKTFQDAYQEYIEENKLTDNPKPVIDGKQVSHNEPVITSGSSYQSDQDNMTKAPESEFTPEGKEIERADSKENLKRVKNTPKVYTQHKRDVKIPSIYIDGQPTSDDIAQTHLGDCYYLAVVASIAAQDPGRIKQLIPDALTGNIKVTLYAKNEFGGFEPQIISLDQNLAYEEGTNLLGSRFKIVPTGESTWILNEMSNGEQYIQEIRYYKTALWAPLLEKAYARFAQQHTRYGFALQPPTSAGYDQITQGGNSEMVYSVFYGSQVKAGTTYLNSDENISKQIANVSEEQIDAIQALIQLNGKTKGVNQGNQAMLMTAGADPIKIFERLLKYTERMTLKDLSQLKESGNDNQALTNIGTLKNDLAKLIEKSKDYEEDDPELKTIQESAQGYGSWLVGYLVNKLDSQRPKARLRHFMQLLHDIASGTAGVDGKARRYIYTLHAYAVLKADFVDKTNKPMHIDGTNRDAVKEALANINWKMSTVTLQNPHHSNSPDFSGKLEKTKDTGVFQLWLTQFFRNFSKIRHGLVEKK